MVSEAHDLGLAAIAVADRDGIYGSARSHAEAERRGSRTIVAAELTLEGDVADPYEPVNDIGGAAPQQAANDSETPRLREVGLERVGPERVIVLVENALGYENLCHLLTLAHAEHEKGMAAIHFEQVAERSAGLTLLVPTDARLISGLSAFEHGAADSLFEIARAFGDRIAVAVHKHLDGDDAARVRCAEILSRRYGIGVVATARPLYHKASRKPLADVLHCVRHKTTLDLAGRTLSPNAEARLRSETEMRRLFRDHPEWVTATVPIAERCRFSLAELRYRFPSEELCLLDETADGALRRLTERGVLVRYPNGVSTGVRAQIEKELALIAKLEVAPYFLSVHQVVEMARSRRILCQGRGSAANSAVCFALGVTAVDPARSNLLFERFLSAERAEPPDIDVDFEHERREEVIQAIYEEYGRDRAAMVSEIIAYRGKSAIKEVGKAFGLSMEQSDRLSQIVFRYDLSELTPARIREQGLDPEDDRIFKMVSLAKALEGFPRHLSIHVGGFVLSAEPLQKVAPIEPARMEGRTVIPWDKDDLDALGFFKVDVLALGMLTAIRKCLGLLHDLGRGPWQSPEASSKSPTDAISSLSEAPRLPFDPIEAFASIPPEDPVVYEAIGHADTVGVFQIESRAQMAMLPRLKPKTFYDLVIEVAIVRPGPIQGGMVHPYLRRRTGKEPATSPHPCLDPILERTLGVPLFQEQVMQIAMVGAGYGAGEADQLRRDMAAWKKHGRLERHRDRLLAGFERTGISLQFGEQLYKQIQGFGEYGFPESHAASFALLVYASAWLKVHHPTAFACSLLNAQPMGFYSPSSIVKDAQRHGVVVLPVCALESDWDHTLVPLAASTGGQAMRLGLRLVSGLGEQAGRAVVEARQEIASAARIPSSVTELVDQAGRMGTALKKNEVEALAEAGAFEAIVKGRRQALWEATAPRLPGLFDGILLEGHSSSDEVSLAESELESLLEPLVDLQDSEQRFPEQRFSEQRLPEERHLPQQQQSFSIVPRAASPKRGAPRFRPHTKVEQLLLDYGRVGLSIHDHPMCHVRPHLGARYVARAVELATMANGSTILVAGLVIGRQRPGTASGVTFVTLEDETGVANLVITIAVWEAHRHAALHAKLVLVSGKLERQGEVIHVLVKTLERLELPTGATLPARSRDFH